MLYSNNNSYSDWIINPFGAAIILFDIPGDHQAFIKDVNNFHLDSWGKSENICIPKEYIIDGC